MRKETLAVPVVLLALCLSGAASGRSIVDTSGCVACFYPYPTNPGGGNPFWVNNSQDNTNAGPLDATDFAGSLYDLLPSISPYPVNQLQYLSASGGVNAALNFYFLPNAAQYSVTMLYTNTGNNLAIGWYDETSNVLNPLFTTDSYSTSPYLMNPAGGFGFYMQYVTGANDKYFTESSKNTQGKGSEAAYEAAAGRGVHQHFVVLSTPDPNVYIVGIEDSWGRSPVLNRYRGIFEGSGDYNDAVFLVQAIPEPSSLGLLGIGIGGLFLYRRKRRA